ncbi:hypothetical protein ES703_55021 [subsurface metagenome]
MKFLFDIEHLPEVEYKVKAQDYNQQACYQVYHLGSSADKTAGTAEEETQHHENSRETQHKKQRFQKNAQTGNPAFIKFFEREPPY